MLNWRIEISRTTYTIRFDPQNGEVSVNAMPVQAVMKHGARGIQYGFMIGKHHCDIAPSDEGNYRLLVDGKPALKPKTYAVSTARDEEASIFRRRRDQEDRKVNQVDLMRQFIPDWLWLMLIPVSLIPAVGRLHPNSLILWFVGVVVLVVIANLRMLKVTMRQGIAYMVTFFCWSVFIIMMSRDLI